MTKNERKKIISLCHSIVGLELEKQKFYSNPKCMVTPHNRKLFIEPLIKSVRDQFEDVGFEYDEFCGLL